MAVIFKLIKCIDNIVMNKSLQDGETALLIAAKSNETDIVKLLFAVDGIDVNVANNVNIEELHVVYVHSICVCMLNTYSKY